MLEFFFVALTMIVTLDGAYGCNFIFLIVMHMITFSRNTRKQWLDVLISDLAETATNIPTDVTPTVRKERYRT